MARGLKRDGRTAWLYDSTLIQPAAYILQLLLISIVEPAGLATITVTSGCDHRYHWVRVGR